MVSVLDPASLSSNRLALDENNHRRFLPTMLSLLFLVTLLFPHIMGTNIDNYVELCTLSSFQAIYLQNDGNGGYFPVNASESNDMNPNFKNTINATDESLFVQARQCNCAPDGHKYYCLEGQGDTCGIPNDSNLPVGCFSSNSKTIFVRNAWPVVLLWYGALLIFLLATENGRNARNFILSIFTKSRNLASAEQIVARESQLREQMRVATMTQHQRVMELMRMRREEVNPNLLLKTKRYCSPTKKKCREVQTLDNLDNDDDFSTPVKDLSVSFDHGTENTSETEPNISFDNDTNSSFVYNENEEEVTCTICILPIIDGDRIGALTCNHLFHSDCLKQWIKRRNVCPLCQEPDIATPQRNSNSNRQNSMSSTAEIEESMQMEGEPQTLDDILSNTGMRTQSFTSTPDWNVRVSRSTPSSPRRTTLQGNMIQRLTLTDNGNVQFSPHHRSRSNRNTRLSRERRLRLSITRRNMHTNINRVNNSVQNTGRNENPQEITTNNNDENV